MQNFRRRLPHQYPPGKWLFLTWHLHGSVPHAMYPPPGHKNSGNAFVWMDRRLDAAQDGPLYLRQGPIAETVVASLRRGVDLTVIALWLGHESVETTQIYLHADMRLKERALGHAAPSGAAPTRFRPSDGLLTFLESL